MQPRNEFRRLASLLNVKACTHHDLGWIITQIRALYREIPGLRLTLEELQYTVGLDGVTSGLVLWTLTDVGFLRAERDGFLMA